MKISEDDHIQSDQNTKKIIIATICGIGWAFALTSCVLALWQIPIPPEVKELTLFVLGVVSGSLIKTGTERTPSVTLSEPVEVKAPAGEPLQTENVNDQS